MKVNRSVYNHLPSIRLAWQNSVSLRFVCVGDHIFDENGIQQTVASIFEPHHPWTSEKPPRLYLVNLVNNKLQVPYKGKVANIGLFWYGRNPRCKGMTRRSKVDYNYDDYLQRHFRRCNVESLKDGYCPKHHPEYVAERRLGCCNHLIRSLPEAISMHSPEVAWRKCGNKAQADGFCSIHHPNGELAQRYLNPPLPDIVQKPNFVIGSNCGHQLNLNVRGEECKF